MPRLPLARAPFLLGFVFLLCLITYRYIYDLNFVSVTLSDLLGIDDGVDRSIYGLTYVDDSFKYEKTLLDGTLLFTFHGGLGLDVFSIFARIFSSVVHPSLSIIFLNCILIFFLYRRLSCLNHCVLVVFVPYMGMLAATLNKELYTVYTLLELPFVLSMLFSFSPKSILNCLSGRVRVRILDSFSCIVFFFSFLCLILSRPGIILALLSFFLLLNSLFSVHSLRISRNLPFAILACFAGVLTFVFLFPSLIRLAGSWDASKNLEGLSFFSIPVNLLYSLSAPFPQPLLQLNLIFDMSPLDLYCWFALLLLSLASVVRILFCFGRLEAAFRFASLKNHGTYLLALALLSAYIGFRGDEITRQLATISIPSLLLFYYYFQSYRFWGIPFAQK